MANQLLKPPLQEVLGVLRQRLAQTLGYELEQLILYGSQARGEARPDSDIDVLIIVRGSVNYPDLMQRTSNLVAEVSLQNDVVISRTFASLAEWENAHTPFLINVRREGITRMKLEIRALLDKATENLKAAKLLLQNGYPEIAASRTYYAMFYVAEALLFSRSWSFPAMRRWWPLTAASSLKPKRWIRAFIGT